MSAAGQPITAEPTAQTDDSIPAHEVMMIGSSPLEAPDETWGIGTVESDGHPSYVVVRYAEGAGWALAPSFLNAAGQPLSGFEPDPKALLAGQVTPGGSGVLLGTVPKEPLGESTATRQVLLVRDPHVDQGAFRETAPLPEAGEAALAPGETLFAEHRAPLTVALDEEGGARAGALVVPERNAAMGAEASVLHWDGNAWTREPIEIPGGISEGFRVLAIGASSPSNAWLLARLPSPAGAIALFRRNLVGSVPRWQPVAPAHGEPAGAPLKGNGEPVTVTGVGPTSPQILNVTTEGVWIEGERADISERLAMFFRPEREGGGEGYSGEAHSWCNAPAGSPPCDYPLSEGLPRGPSRSFAWAEPGTPYGQRVITGLAEGVSLRLEGATFKRVIALGASLASDVGGSLGAAFSNPREGWLGNETLPVHLTLNPAPNRLAPYPVPFRRALLAVAPDPDAPVGALSSEALAVGERGEVARYMPGEGWLPESLFAAGGHVVHPRLRAVAWPTPTRAYAVGALDSAGDPQMWLWRGETGLWEPDPATPRNFRGNLLGIAFDPSNPSRGYAVGQQGVLLRYGKSWTQEALPLELADASFTSIAFAGSEAIVAYRVAHIEGGVRFYTGGVIVNEEGSGWKVDQGAAEALDGDIPWAVAGLPDGGAAISATGLNGTLILERESVSATWRPTAAPYPGVEFEEPASLALFREGGSLRVIGSGGVPTEGTLLEVDTPTPPPAGFPPDLIGPYPLADSGAVVRQTAVGWSDEQHDRNSAQEPPGEYQAYDTVFQPDPVAAVLIDPTGVQGWAVGGFVDDTNEALDTADVERYPKEDGVPPPGFAKAPVHIYLSQATFAIGGNAACLAPCADRANARIGPDEWLSSALERAGEIPGVRAFLYTGPRVTTGFGHGLFPVNYEQEFDRYAEILDANPLHVEHPLQAFAVASSTDGGPGNECLFEQAFSGFPAPVGSEEALGPGQSRSQEPCSAANAQAGYYAFPSTGPAGTVRVVVLDDGSEVGATQLAWLDGQLAEAKADAEPAVAVGNANLNAQLAAGRSNAEMVAGALVRGGASAYFYDSPGENIEQTLTVGSESIPTFGSGTLGYASIVAAEHQSFKGHSGFLLAQVEVGARNPLNNRAPVTARLIPDIGELALEAENGVLLHRSEQALFAALARRPRTGGQAQRGSAASASAVYIPIPAACVGAGCTGRILPEYTFSSSRPDIGAFVERNLASPEANAVLINSKSEPINDEPRNGKGELTPSGVFEENKKHEPINEDGEVVPREQFGVFCAYNAGTTIITISAGGLSSSLPVTVQSGSVRRPCGTQPLKEPASQPAHVAVPPPAPAPAPTPAPATAPPPVPPPPPAVTLTPPPARPVAHEVPPPFFVQPVPPFLVPALVPPPLPAPANPTPPSGTSAVTSPVEAAQKEEENEEATESVSNQAAAYRAPEHEPSSAYLLGIVLLAAFAGSSVARRRPRRGRREACVASATLSGMRSQRRMVERGNRLP
jgi:hypothetical protein